jgi:cobyrinic acid a,c-diamide synthase
MEEADFESRHLGLMTAEEIDDLAERIDRIGQKMEETIDLDRLFAVVGADDADDIEEIVFAGAAACSAEAKVRIAVAKDEAFNFIYADTITALEDAGAEIMYFSPLHDKTLPEDVCGMYLPGGYPELYGRQLSENSSMRSSILEAIKGGLPTIAECGGFLYLSTELEDAEGNSWPMVGLLPGHGSNAGKLVRFGYGYISADKDSLLLREGEQVPVHEFHYWDTTADGSDMTLTKMSTGRQWNFGYAGDTLYAGFPHLYLAGGGLAERFVSACRK